MLAVFPRSPPEKVRICHATNAPDNPYISPDPAIGNNGDLYAGAVISNHKGPVYPAKDWGDIIPPYEYVDKNGETQVFPGYNWTDAGQAIWQHGCEVPPPPDARPDDADPRVRRGDPGPIPRPLRLPQIL